MIAYGPPAKPWVPTSSPARRTARSTLTWSAEELASLVDTVGLPFSPINLVYSNTGSIGSQDADIQVELTIAVGLAARTVEGLAVAAPVSAELDSHNLPEADILVVQGASNRFVTPDMVRIMIEVSASSLRHDLGPKLKLYARTGVPEYWVADVNGRRIIRFHSPNGEQYAERAEFAFGEAVLSATIPGLVVDTSRLA